MSEAKTDATQVEETPKQKQTTVTSKGKTVIS
jgi:hypothetical protein